MQKVAQSLHEHSSHMPSAITATHSAQRSSFKANHVFCTNNKWWIVIMIDFQTAVLSLWQPKHMSSSAEQIIKRDCKPIDVVEDHAKMARPLYPTRAWKRNVHNSSIITTAWHIPGTLSYAVMLLSPYFQLYSVNKITNSRHTANMLSILTMATTLISYVLADFTFGLKDWNRTSLG